MKKVIRPVLGLAIAGAALAVLVLLFFDLVRPPLTGQWLPMSWYVRAAVGGLVAGALTGLTFRDRFYDEAPIRQVNHMAGM